MKAKSNKIAVLISRNLIDSYVRPEEFVLENNVSREYDDMIEKNKNLETSTVHQKF